MPIEQAAAEGNDIEEAVAASPQITIRSFRGGEDADAFRRLNEEWITAYFVLEDKDREVLGQPEEKILHTGGEIFMVHVGERAVGCVALIPMGDGVYELSKMAVSPELRGLGVGRRLLEYAVTEARKKGARSLFLGSSTKLKNAVHLYESVGFSHVPPNRLPAMEYARADVFMKMML
jgi:putative acetyltransferase